MTTTDQIAAIEARAEGLTNLCAEHLRQSIRHVQRNVDIDCNVHEDEDTWGDCIQPLRHDGDRMAAVLADIPALLAMVREQRAALERVEALCSDWDAVVDVFPLTPAALFAGSHAKRVRAALTATEGS